MPVSLGIIYVDWSLQDQFKILCIHCFQIRVPQFSLLPHRELLGGHWLEIHCSSTCLSEDVRRNVLLGKVLSTDSPRLLFDWKAHSGDLCWDRRKESLSCYSGDQVLPVYSVACCCTYRPGLNPLGNWEHFSSQTFPSWSSLKATGFQSFSVSCDSSFISCLKNYFFSSQHHNTQSDLQI